MELLEILECSPRLTREPLDAERAAGVARVCDITGAFELSRPTISHHLKVLKEVGLLTSERRASWVYYRLVPETLG
ncbi:hypothetical protein GCM10009733_025130 [Nonomuraea maheshkhaliensis]|uniref:HTH arsR-type domain-containing protein n=2 Tax=Nonomuraea maheshkhaliensis TaxID=419590 RepID=A0ABN2F4R4_9ACTN